MAVDVSTQARSAAAAIAAAAIQRVQEPTTRRVRVEDYLAVVASATGDAAFIASGVVDIESSDIPPGSPVFGDQVNRLLSDDTVDVTRVTPQSVVGVLIAELTPEPFSLDAFDSLESIYRAVAVSVGSLPWGQVALSVAADNRPSVLPLQVAFDLRPAVDRAVTESGLSEAQRHVLCALALADALRQVSQAIDTRTGLRLALEVTFGVAKMMPMSRRAFAQLSREATPHD